MLWVLYHVRHRFASLVHYSLSICAALKSIFRHSGNIILDQFKRNMVCSDDFNAAVPTFVIDIRSCVLRPG